MTKRTLTWKEWDEQYKPIHDDEGHLKHASDFTEDEWMQIVKKLRNWTSFGGEDGVPPYFLDGYLRANRRLRGDRELVVQGGGRRYSRGLLRCDPSALSTLKNYLL